MFLTKNKLCLVVPLLPAPKALIGPGEEPEGFAGSPPGRLVCATSRGVGNGCAPGPPRERGATWARPVRFPAKRSLPLGYSPRLAHVFRGPRGFSPEVSEKSWKRRRGGVDSSARRVVEWSAVGRSVDTRASFPSFAWGVRPSPRAHTRTRARARSAQHLRREAIVRICERKGRDKIYMKEKIYIMCYCVSFLPLPGDSLRSHYVRNRLANCERKGSSKVVFPLPKPRNLRICERLRT